MAQKQTKYFPAIDCFCKSAYNKPVNFGREHLEISQVLPWFTFGVAEYCFQGLLILAVVACLPEHTIGLRILWYLLGTTACSLAVSLFFRTYLAPEAYELIVKELSVKTGKNINAIKTGYDCFSVALGISLSFAFFGFGVFEGVKLGTVICALIKGFLIDRFSKLLKHHFIFENKIHKKDSVLEKQK